MLNAAAMEVYVVVTEGDQSQSNTKTSSGVCLIMIWSWKFSKFVTKVDSQKEVMS